MIIAAVGLLVGRTWVERLAWSAIVFGAWDIGYYAWLHVFSGWPPSLDTTDLLFLIPVPWAGPVLSPVLVMVHEPFTPVLELPAITTTSPVAQPWLLTHVMTVAAA